MAGLSREYIERAVPLGSSSYYIIRFSPAPYRSDLTHLFAWRRELTNIPLECSDPSVAQARLQWWREEMKRSVNGGTQHPVAIALSETIKTHKLPELLFQKIADIIESDIEKASMAEWEDLHLYCLSHGGSFAELLSHTTGCNETFNPTIRQIGAYVTLISLLRNLGADLRRGHCLLPDSLLRQHRLRPAQLLQPKSRGRSREMLRTLSETATQWRTEALQSLPTQPPAGLRPVLNQLALAHRLHTVLEADGFNVVDGRTHLTPLQKLWTAWRVGKGDR
ncbi:MAG: squalene/phytoene synthase family protein [gamma proteobacterium endosymbiont of Lamellibrachia anaximandri]|nr:squalene/phytoene synthase family protein [gamma proteobacterium endosymbiont of Lamellibrachia anaximandri]